MKSKVLSKSNRWVIRAARSCSSRAEPSELKCCQARRQVAQPQQSAPRRKNVCGIGTAVGYIYPWTLATWSLIAYSLRPSFMNCRKVRRQDQIVLEHDDPIVLRQHFGHARDDRPRKAEVGLPKHGRQARETFDRTRVAAHRRHAGFVVLISRRVAIDAHRGSRCFGVAQGASRSSPSDDRAA